MVKRKRKVYSTKALADRAKTKGRSVYKVKGGYSLSKRRSVRRRRRRSRRRR